VSSTEVVLASYRNKSVTGRGFPTRKRLWSRIEIMIRYWMSGALWCRGCRKLGVYQLFLSGGRGFGRETGRIPLYFSTKLIHR
jgi:hypothetical protein